MPSSPESPKGWLTHYRELLRAWRRKAARHEDAEDAMQDAVLRLLESGQAVMADPRAYLARSTANGLIDRHRRHAILPTVSLHEVHELEQPGLAGPEEAVFSNQLLNDLQAALEELPWVCQQVYVRHRLEGWTHAEIARALGISQAMVEKHMTRALQYLNRRLQRYAP